MACEIQQQSVKTSVFVSLYFVVSRILMKCVNKCVCLYMSVCVYACVYTYMKECIYDVYRCV